MSLFEWLSSLSSIYGSIIEILCSCWWNSDLFVCIPVFPMWLLPGATWHPQLGSTALCCPKAERVHLISAQQMLFSELGLRVVISTAFVRFMKLVGGAILDLAHRLQTLVLKSSCGSLQQPFPSDNRHFHHPRRDQGRSTTSGVPIGCWLGQATGCRKKHGTGIWNRTSQLPIHKNSNEKHHLAPFIALWYSKHGNR